MKYLSTRIMKGKDFLLVTKIIILIKYSLNLFFLELILYTSNKIIWNILFILYIIIIGIIL